MLRSCVFYGAVIVAQLCLWLSAHEATSSQLPALSKVSALALPISEILPDYLQYPENWLLSIMRAS